MVIREKYDNKLNVIEKEIANVQKCLQYDTSLVPERVENSKLKRPTVAQLTGSRVQNTSTDTFLVKALAGQEWLATKDSAVGSLSSLLTSKTKTDLLSNKDLNWEVMTREVNVYDCSLTTTRTDSDGNTITDIDWDACYALSPDDSTYNDVWTLAASYADCNEYLEAQYKEVVDMISKSKADAVAGGYEYSGPQSPTEMVTGSDFGDFYTYWLSDKDRCKTIGVLPTSIINGGNASVVNGTVVFDPTP